MNMASSDLPCLYAIHRGSGGALRLYIMLYLYIHIHRTGDDVVTVYRVVSCGMIDRYYECMCQWKTSKR